MDSYSFVIANLPPTYRSVVTVIVDYQCANRCRRLLFQVSSAPAVGNSIARIKLSTYWR